MASKTAEQVVPPSVDFEATPVQGQVGFVVLDLNGQVVVRSNEHISGNQASVLYKMILEVGMLPEEGFKRLTVSFPSTRYSVARDKTHVYIVQTQIS
jgi:hypothetical protein